MNLKIRLLALLFLMFLNCSFGQSTSMKQFTINNGLPSNTVYSLFFDSKGFLWAGTDKGIARYNGDKFTVLTTDDGLPDNEVFCFNEDHEGRIWISSFKGILCYFKDNVFYTEANAPWLKLHTKFASSFIGRWRLQKDSSLLAESFDGRYIAAIKGENVKIYNTEKLKDIVGEYGRTILSEKQGSYIRVFYNEVSFLIDSQSNIIKREFYPSNEFCGGSNSSDVDGLISRQGIKRTDGTWLITREIKNIEPATTSFFYKKDSANFYIATSTGLLYGKHGVMLDGKRLTAIDHDNLGNIWIGTLKDGIFCLSKSHSDIFDEFIGNKIVVSRKISDAVCFVTDVGDIYYVKAQGHSHPQFTVERSGYKKKLFTRNNTCIDENGDVLSLQGFSLFYKKKGDKNFRNIKIDVVAKTSGFPTKSMESTGRIFYISTVSRIFAVDRQTLAHSKKLVFKNLILHASNDRIYASAINPENADVWFSKNNSVFCIKGKRDPVEVEIFRGRAFRQLSFYGNYLVGSTDNNKLFIYDSKTKLLDSLPNSNCIWENIYQINDSVAIINTSSYYRILTLHNFYKNGKLKYDLQTIENPFIPKQADFIFGQDSLTFFLKEGMLAGFGKQVLYERLVPPTPVFISLKSERQTYSILKKIHIPYQEAKNINIFIDNICYSNNELVTQYSISQNEREDWNTISGNEINLNGVSPGTYTVKLRSKTFGSRFSVPVVLKIYVGKPFWFKWWFIGGAVFLALILLYVCIRVYLRFQLRRNQRKYEAEMKFQQSEYKALNALMNPHFIFNSLNNIQGLINKNNPDIANQYLVIFSRLIRQNMVNIAKGFVSLYQELLLVENYLNLEKLRFKELVNYNIDVEDSVDTEDIMISPLLIQPLVENAVIHGLLPRQSSESMIDLKVYEINELLYIDIIDNGIGLGQSARNKDAHKESYGLSNLHARVDHLRKMQLREITFEIRELFNEDGNSTGTLARITIKLDFSSE